MAAGILKYTPQRLGDGVVLASTTEPVHYCCPACADNADHLVILFVTWSGTTRLLTCNYCGYQVEIDGRASPPPEGTALQSFTGP